jgi:deoxyribodipyrimidine photo-lyase
MTTIVWFRNDLRTSDHPALTRAASRGPIVPVYILDESGRWPPGAASRWWLHHSLAALRRRLGGLVLLRGEAHALLRRLAKASGATAAVWNRRYDPDGRAQDAAAIDALARAGIAVETFGGNLLHEPDTIATRDRGPFKVYTPFWRHVRALAVPPPLPPVKAKLAPSHLKDDRLEDWQLVPARPNWAAGWERLWQPGEAGAHHALDAFVTEALAHYATLRDQPDGAHTSRLSPHLHFGEISPRQVFTRIAFATDDAREAQGAEKFLAELGWREFCHHLLYHFPDLPERNWRGAFDRLRWRNNDEHLRAWQHGQTGYPLVDAGMRELWQTGWMHNRVRMIAASFLVKHLQIDWRRGEEWFWDTLVDADLANNAAGWQWVTGSGADAAPYFRIFNPVVQGRKFDPGGRYVRRWCPELAKLPADVLHAPFEAGELVLRSAGVTLGREYPHPIVEHRAARSAALAAYTGIKEA